MKIEQRDFRKKMPEATQLSLTIGNFDGLHRGHQELIRQAGLWAKEKNCPLGVLTFYPHPSQVVGSQPVESLFSQEDQIKQMERLGVDHLLIQNFDDNFSQISPEDFLRQYLFPQFRPQAIFVGDDFSFGRQAQGDLSQLSDFCRENSCHFCGLEAIEVKGQRVSSSLVRQLLKAGDLNSIEDLLGRRFSYTGEVIRGDQLGRTLGFPTANLSLSGTLLPPHGVYLVKARLEQEKFFGLVNLGTRPTVTQTMELRFECHLLQFSRDIYGQKLELEFIVKVRDEKKFSNVNELKSQMQEDLKFAQQAIEKNRDMPTW